MKERILAFLITTLFISSVLVSADEVKNQNICSMGNEVEQYDRYGINAYSIVGHGGGSWQQLGEHGLEMSPGSGYIPGVYSDDCEAFYEINIGCSDLGLQNNEFRLGILYKDVSLLGNGPDMWVKDSSGNWYQKSNWHPIGKPSNFEWRYFTLDSSFVDDNENIQIKFYAEVADDTIIDKLCIQYTDNEERDQKQTNCNGAEPLSTGLYQAFTPQFEKLTRVKLLLRSNSHNSGGSFYLNICTDMDPRIQVTSTEVAVNFGTQGVLGPDTWIECDLEDKYIALVPGRTYYLEISSVTGTSSWCYSGGSGNPVYCFKTYGSESCSLVPNMEVSPRNLNFGNVKKGYTVTPQPFYIENTGDKGSVFKWKITEAVPWVTVSETEGVTYNPRDGSSLSTIWVSIDVSTLEGDKDGKPYSGEIIVSNVKTGETIKVTVQVSVVKSRAYNFQYNLLQKVLDKFLVLLKIMELRIFGNLNGLITN